MLQSFYNQLELYAVSILNTVSYSQRMSLNSCNYQLYALDYSNYCFCVYET